MSPSDALFSLTTTQVFMSFKFLEFTYHRHIPPFKHNIKIVTKTSCLSKHVMSSFAERMRCGAVRVSTTLLYRLGINAQRHLSLRIGDSTADTPRCSTVSRISASSDMSVMLNLPCHGQPFQLYSPVAPVSSSGLQDHDVLCIMWSACMFSHTGDHFQDQVIGGLV